MEEEYLPLERIPDIYITKKFRIKITYAQRRFIDEQIRLCNIAKLNAIRLVYGSLSNLIEQSSKGDKEAGYLIGSLKRGKKTVFRNFYNEIYQDLNGNKEAYGIEGIYHDALTATIMSVCNAFATAVSKYGKLPQFKQLPFYDCLKHPTAMPLVNTVSINIGKRVYRPRNYIRHNLLRMEKMHYVRLYNTNPNYFTIKEWNHVYGISIKKEIDGKYWLLVKMRFEGETTNEIWDGPASSYYRQQFINHSKIDIPVHKTVFTKRKKDNPFVYETPRVEDYPAYEATNASVKQLRFGTTFVITANHFWGQVSGLSNKANIPATFTGNFNSDKTMIPDNFRVDMDPILKRKIDVAYAYKRKMYYIALKQQKQFKSKDIYHSPKMRRCYKRYHKLWQRVINYKRQIMHRVIRYILRYLPRYITCGFYRTRIPEPPYRRKDMKYSKWLEYYMTWRYKVETNIFCTELIRRLRAKAHLLGIAPFKIDWNSFDGYNGSSIFHVDEQGKDHEYKIKIGPLVNRDNVQFVAEYVVMEYSTGPSIRLIPQMLAEFYHIGTINLFIACLKDKRRVIQYGDVIKPEFLSWYPICNTLIHQSRNPKELNKLPPEYIKAFGYHIAESYIIKNPLNRKLCGLEPKKKGESYVDPTYSTFQS